MSEDLLEPIRQRIAALERDHESRCDQVDKLQQRLDEIRVAVGGYFADDLVQHVRVRMTEIGSLTRRLAALEAENARLRDSARTDDPRTGPFKEIGEAFEAILERDEWTQRRFRSIENQLDTLCGYAPEPRLPRSSAGETNTSAVPVWEAGGGTGSEPGAATVGRAADVLTTSEGAAIREDAGASRRGPPSDASQPASNSSNFERKVVGDVPVEGAGITASATSAPSISPQPAARWSEEHRDAASKVLGATFSSDPNALCAEIAKHAHLFCQYPAAREISAEDFTRAVSAGCDVYWLPTGGTIDVIVRAALSSIGITVKEPQ